MKLWVYTDKNNNPVLTKQGQVAAWRSRDLARTAKRNGELVRSDARLQRVTVDANTMWLDTAL